METEVLGSMWDSYINTDWAKDFSVDAVSDAVSSTDSSWWDGFLSAFDGTKDFLKDNITADGLKGVSAVAGAIGTYQNGQRQQKQFDEMMKLKIEDYNRDVERQNKMDESFSTGYANSSYGKLT